MNVLQVGPNSIHVRLFSKAMMEHGIDCSFLAEEKIDGYATQFFSFRSSNPLSLIANYQQLKIYLKNARPDLVHIHQVNRLAVFVARACRKLNIPVVVTAWGSDVLLVPNKGLVNKRLVQSVLKNAAVITADADSMIEAINNLTTPLKKEIHSIQYGIDPVTSKQVKENLIFSNRLHSPLYNIDKVITDFAAFHQLHPDWKLVIGGVGDQTENLKSLALKSGLSSAVEFVGWLNAEQNANWYSRAKIYVSIPESDGMSVSILEALSAACIPVCSDIAVTLSWLKDGVNGIIRKPNVNPFEEALAINQESCIKQNREWVASFAYRSATIPRFIAIYNKLLN
jgi:glycosyltransferase involved in cell wall biosynthesis